MAYLESNSTHTPLMANQIFTGRAEIVNPVYITIQISFRTDVSGTLEVYHSFDGSSFSTYGDSFYYNAGNHHKQVAIKGSFIYVKYINGNFNQTYFDLHSKLADTVREEMEVSLNSMDDSVSIPRLEQCISGNVLSVNLGSTSDVICYARDGAGNNKVMRFGNDDRLKVDISGVYSDIGLKVDISGQYLRADLSGSNINDVIAQQRLLLIHNDVSGVDSRLLNLHNDSVNIHNDVSGVDGRLLTLHNDSVNIHNDVSGVDNRLLVLHNDVSGVDNRLYNIYNSSMSIHNDVSGVDSRLVTLHNDNVILHNDVSGFRFNGEMLKVDISGQFLKLNVTDLSGVTVNLATVNPTANIGARIMGAVGTGYEDIKSDGHKHLLVSITDSGESKFASFNSDGGLATHCMNFADISGSRVDISGQSVRITSMPSFSVTSDISGQTVRLVQSDLSGVNVRVNNLVDLSGVRVDISGQTIIVKDLSGHRVDISGQSLRMMGFDGVDTYNNLYVDANGFISANVLSTAHENIYLGFDTYYADYCSGSNNVGIWKKDNPNALSVDGWYCSSPASTNEVSIYTYLNHFFGAYNQSDFTFGDIDTWYCVMQNWNCVNSNTMPTVRVYSATSRWDYTINAGQALNNGEAIMPYFGLLSRIKNNDTEVRRVHYSLTGGTGVRGSGENITKIEMYIPATVSEFIEMNVIEGAVYVKNKGLINYYYTNDKVGREQNDINEIRKQTDKLTFKTTGELKVDISGQIVDISGQRVDISGCDVRTKGMWLNTELQHMNNPATFGDPNIIKSADGAMSSYINGATNVYDVYTNKLNSGNMAPINTVQTEYDSTAGFYRQSLCVKDVETYKLMTNSGILVGGKNAGGSFKTLRLDDNGRVDISGQGMLLNAYSRTDGGNRVATLVQPSGSVSTARALETYSYIVGLSDNIIGGENVPMQITSTTGNTTQSLDTYIRNGSTTNNKITGFPNGGNIGLNMYVIPTKTRTFSFNAYTNATIANAMIGSQNLNINWIDRNFGLANPRQISVMRSATSSATLNLTMEYIDTAGNEQTVVVPAPLPTTPTFVITGVINVNKWRTNASLTTNDTLNIMFGSGINFSYAGGTYQYNNNGLFTCPNNAIAWVQTVSFVSSATDQLRLFKWDATGVRHTMFGWLNASNFNANATGEYGFGGYITAGETIGWGAESSTTYKIVNSHVVVRYL